MALVFLIGTAVGAVFMGLFLERHFRVMDEEIIRIGRDCAATAECCKIKNAPGLWCASK